MLLISGNALGEEPNVVWDVAGEGLFDQTNKAYVLEDGLVTVDIRKTDDGEIIVDSPGCPTGLGHLASGRESVKQIKIVFQHDRAGDCWLHVAWNPGGSGKEQFEVLWNGRKVGTSQLRDGSAYPYQMITERFQVNLVAGENTVTLGHLSGDGLRLERITLAKTIAVPAMINSALKFPTLQSYEERIREPGLLIDDCNIRLYAPKQREVQAKIIFGYLVKAYDELYEIVGVHAKYKIVVYHFPPKDAEAWGGTSNCTLWYSYNNLDLESDEEWKRYRVPHVSGYIEEMAHNFVHATGAQFGWEMIGWTIAAKVSKKVADNGSLEKQLENTRKKQAETFRRYLSLNNTFPRDLKPNLCDRIHAYILWMCERQYGPAFWPDFFAELSKEHQRLIAAERDGATDDERRNKRYQITVECFDRICRRKGIDFKGDLVRYGVSLTVDVKSLHPKEPGWNRKLH